ncbi:recombinase family protein [Paraburkholderia sp. BL25I1N1]|uniref:recombinase family protein n=1 Tax=Paraburkholderia sp. BL25I1N1 TaxID=1938804 RepID=UPI000D402D36|nr:recombinase family protein [Paraburkholderia sp. BL25I1N1]PRY05996.1 DNA invertase Pin-like site-specific DNA recombinase [Paraburkholderia sp. BL25I1N1]
MPMYKPTKRQPSTLLKAAQYIRMSTDQQQCSPVFQRQAIAQYAAAHSIRIVRDYEDAGISGLTLRARPALTQLLIDTADPARCFTLILVYDVSRWGRFQDIDESAFYEYVCRRQGVKIIYVAEPFEVDASPLSPVMKALKRVMAGEYSRELSRKVFLGHCILAERGNHVGGRPPYGYQRLLHDDRHGTTRVLERYEYKSIRTDRVTLTPGPASHVGIVRKIFQWYAWEQATCAAIAQRLNDTGLLNGDSRVWLPRYVAQILHNPAYVGTGLYSRTSSKLAGEWHRVPEAEWISVPNAFPAIVNLKTFNAVQQRFADTRKRPSRKALLDGLRKVVARHGRVNQGLLRRYRRTPSVRAVMTEFGSLNAAYREIGYAPNLNPVREENRDREHRMEALVAMLTANALTERGHTVTYEKQSLTLCVDHVLTFQLVVRAPWMVHGTTPYWSARWPNLFAIDFLVFCRMARDSKELLDFFVIPSGYLTPGKFETLVGPSARDYTMYRHLDLRVLLELADQVNLTGAVMLAVQSEKASSTRQQNVLDRVQPEPRHLSKPSRPPRVRRIQLSMQQQVFKAKFLSAAMEQVAEVNRELERALSELLRHTGFVAVLADSGISVLPRLLVSRVMWAHSSRALHSNSASTDGQIGERSSGNAVCLYPESLPRLTVNVLQRMSSARADSAMGLMNKTTCVAGDFALALLAATPDDHLRVVPAGACANGRLRRRLARQERELRDELGAIERFTATYQLELVELTLHRSLGRQLAAQSRIQTWLYNRDYRYLELLQSVAGRAGPLNTPRRVMRVAQ